MERVDWAGYGGSPVAGGGWSERLIVSGKRSERGLAAGLSPGGPRPLLAALPAGTLLAASVNVADGGKLWREVLAALEGTEAGALAAHGGELAGRLAGKDFAADLAPRFRGELSAAWLLPSQGLVPQLVLGAGLQRGSAEALTPLADRVLQQHFFGGGEVRSAEYRGVRLCWLSGQGAVNPLAPSPGYCFAEDRLLASGSSVHLKEVLAARGERWLSAAEYARLAAPALCARVSLRRSMPFLVGEARRLGLTDRLGARAAASLPSDEDLADHLDFLELTAESCPEGLSFALRSPVPAVPAAALGLLLGE
jgi:hypothetical protein